MYPVVRALYHLGRESFRPRPHVLTEELRLSMRVMPWDCDANLHINNGRYLTLMDLGRMQLFVRHGLLRRFMGRGWGVVAASVHVVYHRPINLFKAFQMGTRVAAATDKFMTIEHAMYSGERMCTLAHVNVAFTDKRGIVPSVEVIKMLDLSRHQIPTITTIEQAARATDQALLAAIRRWNDQAGVSGQKHDKH
ncbi:MAG: acyl-CoA thioesterase [Pseudomonadota bacterium]|nr:acyl-CoA thioesterase [Pseudomonadota bacterium]